MNQQNTIEDTRREITAPALFEAWQRADDAWMAALRRAFGADACNRRYDIDQSEHPQECRDLCAVWMKAGQVWRNKWEIRS